MRSIFPQFPLLITHEFSHIPSSETDRPPVSKKQLHDAKESTAVCCALLGLSIKSIFIRAAARIQKRLLRKRFRAGGVYLGLDTLRGRKFPHGNFRTSVFCEVKTQIVGKTKFFDSLKESTALCCALLKSVEYAVS